MYVITGQTGTGKTSLALQIARQQNGALISADSRQVFTGMDIGTGKIDSPADLEYQGNTWYLCGVPIYGINLINPNQVFSAGDFAAYGREVIAKIQSQGMLPIVVGGTGFYLKSLLDPDDTVFIPQNDQLRDTLEKLSVAELQAALATGDPVKLSNMNNSDRHNPRRLVRALEVAEWKKQNACQRHPAMDFSGDITWIGLTAPKETLLERITKRITQMLENNLENEVRTLASNYSWETPGLQTIGYREWQGYFAGEKTLEQVKQNMITAHLQYARKQMIYFKRLPQIAWRDISQP